MTFAETLGATVGAHISTLRRERKLTQSELARRIDSHRPIVSRIERGTHACDLRTYARIARALGVDLVTMLGCIDGLSP